MPNRNSNLWIVPVALLNFRSANRGRSSPMVSTVSISTAVTLCAAELSGRSMKSAAPRSLSAPSPAPKRRHVLQGSPHGHQDKYTSQDQYSPQYCIAQHVYGQADGHERNAEKDHTDRANNPHHWSPFAPTLLWCRRANYLYFARGRYGSG